MGNQRDAVVDDDENIPVWGKLSDMLDRKTLLRLALIVFCAGSGLAGLAQTPSWLIACRVLQGLGTGGLIALPTVIIADITSPRARSKYMGVIAAVMSVGTVAGPLLGGLITDTIGWRFNFYVGLPIALVAPTTWGSIVVGVGGWFHRAAARSLARPATARMVSGRASRRPVKRCRVRHHLIAAMACSAGMRWEDWALRAVS
jgi:MFS family permease